MAHHIYPVADIIEHETESASCICDPVIDGNLIIHRAMDGRCDNPDSDDICAACGCWKASVLAIS